jgi:hypothetical protein
VIQFVIGALTVMATDCNEQSVISSSQSAQIADYLLMLFRVGERVPGGRSASYGRRVACRDVAMNWGLRFGPLAACAGWAVFLVVRW